ncbi:MAG: TetR family transcriptional regulator [Niabella sp.]
MSKKEYILEKAEALFAEKGFDATSVRDIAKEAGINIAMISYYFGSKDKLMEALFKMRMTIGLTYIKEIAENPDLNIVQKIEKLLSGYVERVCVNVKFYKVILAEQGTNKNRNILKFLNKSKETYASFFDMLLNQGYKEGVFTKKVDTIFFMTTVTGTIMQSILNKHLYAEYYGAKVSKEWIRDVYFVKVKEHLQTITKSILGYEQKN